MREQEEQWEVIHVEWDVDTWFRQLGIDKQNTHEEDPKEVPYEMLQEAIIRQDTITTYLKKLEKNMKEPSKNTVSLPEPHWKRVNLKESDVYLHQAKQEVRLADRELLRIKEGWKETLKKEEGQGEAK